MFHLSVLQLMGTLFAIYIGKNVLDLYRNVQEIKKTGIPYFIAPVCPHRMLYRYSSLFWGPWVENIPGFSFVRYTRHNWNWIRKWEPFEKHGEIFACVSPGATQLFVGDPVAMWDMANKRVEFPKDIGLYKAIDVYGKNVVTTEGKEWRLHRKITAPPFSEKNNSHVFYESLRQAHEAAKYWTAPKNQKDLGAKKPVNTVSTFTDDFMRISLQVIAKAGFSKSLQWPSADGSIKGEVAEGSHMMTFQGSLGMVLHKIIWYIATPKWLLRNSPFKFQQDVYTAVNEWREYMLEIYREKKQRLDKEGPDALLHGGDLMDSLVPREVPEGTPFADGKKDGLTLPEILGNTYVFMLAGHETTAHTMHYTLIFLALNPQYQRKIQAELDALYPDPNTELNYERDYPALADGWVHAALNETLRLYQPVIHIPKTSYEPHLLKTRERGDIMIPPNWNIEISTMGAHRNPRYWSPHTDAYMPERWFSSKEAEDVSTWRPTDKDEKRLKKPVNGSFMPFSEGFRACLGKKFAQVEMVAVMAEFLRNYSVELAVDERKESWEQVAERTKKDFDQCFITITLSLTNTIPLSIVRRGEERFAGKVGSL
ncbi:cytochrome P450 [Ascobolus immersus RN42]|uniref:Cytochrome P450 n=1 Tax=Ascobolus immersus RN42 TaxID=1160509 RepID=A0A3N4ID75_ASCIM|nr:cytochrome P450 [Ascobolus immersus RN42]